MPILLRIPRLYPEMEEATVGRWMAGVGDTLQPHQPIVEIITDKVSYEVESPENAGTVVLLIACAAEKSTLPVDSVLAIMGSADETQAALPDWRAENVAIAAARRASLQTPSAGPVSRPGPSPSAAVGGLPASQPGVIRATPAARRAVKAAGVTLEEVAAGAAGATVTETDVERYLSGKAGS
ncbi:MAG: hypothetical protein LC772_07570 [Chloroflexi bacterium]|nr:hypothetical protein [Chloroflexota bacterium]